MWYSDNIHPKIEEIEDKDKYPYEKINFSRTQLATSKNATVSVAW